MPTRNRGGIGQSHQIRLLALLVLVVAAAAAAQDPEVRLAVERERVGRDETFVIEVTVLGTSPGAEEPELALNGNFEILGRTKRHSISFVNGETVVEARFEFVARPVQAGVFDLGPASVRWDGGRLESATRRMHVLPGSGPAGLPARDPASAPGRGSPDPFSTFANQQPAPAAANKILLVADLSADSVFVGERVTYSLELLTQRRVSGVHPRSEPQYTGFWAVPTEVPSPPKSRKRSYRGHEYDAYLLRRAELYPTSAGVVAIEPAVWDVTVVIPDFLFSETEQLTRSTQPLELTVEALPETGRPAEFAGAVGSYTIEARLEPAAAMVGDALLLVATIHGDGNLSALPQPSLPAMPDFRLYSTSPRRSSKSASAAARAWEMVLVARAPGEHTISALEYPYFDPAAREYRVARSEPMAVAIAARPDAVVDAAGGAAIAGEGRAVGPLRQDIAHIKQTAPDLGEARRSADSGGPLVVAAVAPVALNLVALVVLWVRRRRAADPDERRRRGAHRTARQRLDAAALVLRRGQTEPVAELVVRAIHGYFADRFGEEATGLSRDRLAALCTAHGVDGAADGVGRLLDRLDRIRFTPAATSAEGLAAVLREARGRLSALDRSLGAQPRKES